MASPLEIRPEEIGEWVNFCARAMINDRELRWRHNTHARSFLEDVTRNLVLEVVHQAENYHSVCSRLDGNIPANCTCTRCGGPVKVIHECKACDTRPWWRP